MSSLDEIRQARIAKLEKLIDAGIDPFPANVNQDYELQELSENFSKLSKPKKQISVVGRIMSLRPQGGLTFFHLDDGSGRFQVLLKKGSLISHY